MKAMNGRCRTVPRTLPISPGMVGGFRKRQLAKKVQLAFKILKGSRHHGSSSFDANDRGVRGRRAARQLRQGGRGTEPDDFGDQPSDRGVGKICRPAAFRAQPARRRADGGRGAVPQGPVRGAGDHRERHRERPPRGRRQPVAHPFGADLRKPVADAAAAALHGGPSGYPDPPVRLAGGFGFLPPRGRRRYPLRGRALGLAACRNPVHRDGAAAGQPGPEGAPGSGNARGPADPGPDRMRDQRGAMVAVVRQQRDRGLPQPVRAVRRSRGAGGSTRRRAAWA